MANSFSLKNGTILLSTEAPGGLYNSAQLKKIAQICESDMAIVKATEDQRLALFVKEEEAPAIANELKKIGLGIRHYQDGLHQPIACIGELCPDHEQDALGSAMELTDSLSSLTLGTPLKIGLNGCFRCCVPCHTFDVSVIGDSSGYRISLGGKSSQIPEMASFMAEGVPAGKLTALLTKVVCLYRDNAEAGETLQDVMDRCGAQAFIEALAPYSQDAAAGGDDPFAPSSTTIEEAGEPGFDVASDDMDVDALASEELDVDAFASEEMDVDALASEEMDVDAFASEEMDVDAFASEEIDVDALASEELDVDAFASEEMDVPEVIQLYPSIRLEASSEIAAAVETLVEGQGSEMTTVVRYRDNEMRPYVRFLIAKELFKHLCRSENSVALRFKDAPEEVLDVQANIFAGMLLIPGKMMRSEVDRVDSSLDLVTQLAEIFWVSKALMNQRLRDYLENLS